MTLPHTDPAALEAEALAASDLTLDELADLANREHRLAGESIAAGLAHAVKAGGALLAAYAQILPGERMAWLSNNFAGSRSAGTGYMRLARYADLIPLGIDSIQDAALALRGMPAADYSNGLRKATPEILEEAARLTASGLSIHAAAREVGLSRSTLTYHLVPGEKDRQHRRNAEKAKRRRLATKALLRQEQDRAVKHHGGDPARAYEHVRKAAQALQAAADDAPDAAARSRWSEAQNALYAVEDAIAAALRLT